MRTLFRQSIILGAAAALVLTMGCQKRRTSPGAANAGGGTPAAQNGPGLQDPVAPTPMPADPKPAKTKGDNVFVDRFLALWTDIHKSSNGYFSAQGIPYHSVETLIVEAPDYGHTTTSEAYSYYIWLESMYGKVTGDWSFLERAWQNMEYYIIPTHKDQPTNQSYSANKAATYAPENPLPDMYPSKLDSSAKVGKDPLAAELKQTYGHPDIYAMHWLLDVDNWYGYGQRGDGVTKPSYFNTFQRGGQESVWETVPHPSWDEFKWGGPNGFLDLFVSGTNYARQWRYTNAPDADTRAVQAIYWAKTWADEAGGNGSVDRVVDKAAMLGDFVRYALFDKYFKKPNCQSPTCPEGSGYDAAHYLLSWYFAWGGSHPADRGSWAWRIGSSHCHSGYQNPVAAYALSAVEKFRPKSPNAARDWRQSLDRQLEFYRWLQSAEGGIAGGATDSWDGHYAAFPAGAPVFYGMVYDEAPVFRDPPSNEWFGFQVWSLQRVAEYYYITGDQRAKVIMDKWVSWAIANTKLEKNGGYQVPATLKWIGKPQSNWDANSAATGFDAGKKDFNSTLHVEVTATTDDVGTAAGLAHTLTFYAAKANNDKAATVAKELLDRMWEKFRDDKGMTTGEKRLDYKRFADKIFVPPQWKGKMANGDVVDANSTFISIRSKYKNDPNYPKLEAWIKAGGQPEAAPEFKYHRFWAQSHIALAYATFGWLFPDKS